MLVSDLCHFLCFVIDEYYNGMKRRMTLMSCLKIHIQTKNLCHFVFPNGHKNTSMAKPNHQRTWFKEERDWWQWRFGRWIVSILIFLIFFFCCLLCIFQLRIKKYIILIKRQTVIMHMKRHKWSKNAKNSQTIMKVICRSIN